MDLLPIKLNEKGWSQKLRKKYSKILLKICKKKPISLEVFADNFKDMEKQALKINSWGKEYLCKNHCSKQQRKIYWTINQEIKQKRRLNITAVYTVSQVKKIVMS